MWGRLYNSLFDGAQHELAPPQHGKTIDDLSPESGTSHSSTYSVLTENRPNNLGSPVYFVQPYVERWADLLHTHEMPDPDSIYWRFVEF